MVLAYSNRISPVPLYSFFININFHLQDYHPLWYVFPIHFCSFYINFWALPLSLATTHRITIVFFSSWYLDVSVPKVTFILQWNKVFNLIGFPIRTSMDLCLFAAPHSLSQLTTSFVVSKSLGIPRTPLFASFLFLLFILYYFSLVILLPNLSMNFFSLLCGE